MLTLFSTYVIAAGASTAMLLPHLQVRQDTIRKKLANVALGGDGSHWPAGVPLHTTSQASTSVPQRTVPSLLLRHHRDWVLRIPSSPERWSHQDW